MLVKQLTMENVIFLYKYEYCTGTFRDRFEYLILAAGAIIILAGCRCLCWSSEAVWSSLIFDVLPIQTVYLLVYGVVCNLNKLRMIFRFKWIPFTGFEG